MSISRAKGLKRKFQKLLYDLYLEQILYLPLMKVSTYGNRLSFFFVNVQLLITGSTNLKCNAPLYSLVLSFECG